ncbi:MAG: molecular chaperone TorD family protein [Deltaproteobacteria bacterium]|jgi:TorA maturation chaperone TorD|nr:molecular chaperone TorD family protein [Deltaproteobacteria bacterium]MBW2483019.1 molecular chaperone TorD family protein [Deltaproteobacteria bacterium]
MTAQDFFELEYLRLNAYRLLADGYHRPEQSLLDSLEKLAVCMERVCSDAGQYIEGMLAGIAGMEGVKTLEVDHARLFVGPFNLLAPPYGSVYLEGERQVMGASTADVKMRYQAVGLDVDTGFKDAPDHVAAELEFMHVLIFKALEAAGKGDARHIVASLTNQQAFLEIHLGAWIHEFAGKVIDNAATSFYRNLARATETFIKDDYHILTSSLNSWSSNPEKSAEIESSCGQC